MKNRSLKVINSLLVLFAVLTFFVPGMQIFVQADDLLETAFQESIANENIIILGNNKNAVGNEVFREGQEINSDTMLQKTCFINNAQSEVEPIVCAEMWGTRHPERLLANKCDLNNDRIKIDNDTLETKCTTMWGERKRFDLVSRPPLLVRIAKLLLRLTVALAITMVIYNSIMYIAESMKGSDQVTKARNNLIYVWAGLILALMSVAIINLSSSLSISSLKNAAEYLEESFRDKFTEFCDWARADRWDAETNLNPNENLDNRTQEKLQTFCANPAQPINRTQRQINSFIQRIMEHPGSRSEQDFYQFLDRIESQFWFEPDLEWEDDDNNNNTPPETIYGTYEDLRVTTVSVYPNTNHLGISFRNTGDYPVIIDSTHAFSVSCENLDTGEDFPVLIIPPDTQSKMVTAGSTATILNIPYGGGSGEFDCEIN